MLNKVTINLNVFGAFMKYNIFGDTNTVYVVTVERSEVGDSEAEVQE